MPTNMLSVSTTRKPVFTACGRPVSRKTIESSQIPIASGMMTLAFLLGTAAPTWSLAASPAPDRTFAVTAPAGIIVASDDPAAEIAWPHRTVENGGDAGAGRAAGC